jgi:hypothetical protein
VAIVREIGQLTQDLVFLDLPARLAKLLLARQGAGPRVELGVTQAELAAQLGMARSVAQPRARPAPGAGADPGRELRHERRAARPDGASAPGRGTTPVAVTNVTDKVVSRAQAFRPWPSFAVPEKCGRPCFPASSAPRASTPTTAWAPRFASAPSVAATRCRCRERTSPERKGPGRSPQLAHPDLDLRRPGGRARRFRAERCCGSPSS